MNKNADNKSSLALGVVAFLVIVAVVVALFSISANKNGGSPVNPDNEIAATETTTEA